MPAAERLSIRRRQNNESYRRGKDKEIAEEEEMKSKMTENSKRIKSLEVQVIQLENTLKTKRKTRKEGKGKPGSTSGEYFQKEGFFGDPF